MRFIDFFIKDAQDLDIEWLFKRRVLVLMIQAGFVLAIIVSVLQMLGYFKGESILLLLVCGIMLLISKYYGGDRILLFLISFSTLYTLYINIKNTGNSYSYNHKWYIMGILIVFLVRPKWLWIIFPVIVLFQIYFYIHTASDILLENIGTIDDHFIDNLIFLATFCVFIWIFDLNNNLQNAKIRNQNLALTQQKQKLQINNSRLTEMTQELTLANKELERFAYAASHDLKEPCQNIIGFLKILKRKLNLEEKDTQMYYDILEKNAFQMRELIRDTLEFSNIKENVTLEQVDVNSMLEEIKKLILPELKAKNAQVIIGSNMPTLYVPKDRLQTVFKNLVENGIKYNHTKEPIININYASKEKMHVFCIKDNGMGLKPEQYHKIFDMYVRLHNREEYSGTGLGLAICKKIINQMKGDIWVESEPNIGSTFFIQIPKNDKI